MPNPFKTILTIAASLALSLALAQFGAPSSLSFANMNAYLSVQTNSAAVCAVQQNLDRINQRSNANPVPRLWPKIKLKPHPRPPSAPVRSDSWYSSLPRA